MAFFRVRVKNGPVTIEADVVAMKVESNGGGVAFFDSSNDPFPFMVVGIHSLQLVEMIDITDSKLDLEQLRVWREVEIVSSKRKQIPTRSRAAVLARDGNKCRMCGRNSLQVVLEVDHIVPASLGGSDELDNLQTLCRECNLGKSNHFCGGGKGV
jgi:hypothetical protein